MDLPTCPACGQSVLDENPETCPFCGASMKKGGKSQPKSDAGATKSAGKSAEKKTPAGKDEDPFAIETSAQKAAVRVALRRSPERDYRVQCPMCETVGYIPKSAAGRSVKCANPSCMVPVFEAPEIKEEAEPEPEPSKGTSPAIIGAAVMMMAVAGFSVWYFMIRDPNAGKDDIVIPVPDRNQLTEVKPPAENTTDPEKVEPEPEPEFDFVAFRQTMLDKTMQEIARSRERNSQPNRPPDCRQLLAETYARLNQIENAQDQLPHIDKLDRRSLFNKRLSPLIAIAWKQQDPEEVKNTITEAERAAEGVPSAGRSRFDNLSALAALLVAQDRSTDARRWIEKAVNDANINDPVRKERLRQASSHLRVLRDVPDYPFSPLLDHPAHRWAQPEWVTVTMLLAGHGQDEKAVAWARSSPRERVRGDSLLAFSRWKILQGKMSAADVEQLVKEEPPVNQIRILAEASSQFHDLGDRESAAKLLTAATVGVDSFTAAEEFQFPSPPRILKLELPDPAPVMNRVLALSALARAQVDNGETEKGFETVQTALKMCRSIAPSPSALASRPHDQDDPGAEAVEQALKEKLNLNSDNQVRKSFNDYVSQLKSFEETSQLRFQAEEALLSEAVFWGLAPRVWEEMQARIDETDNDLKEPWLESKLLPEVANALQAENSTQQLNELNRRTGNRLPDRDPQLRLISDLDQMIEKRNFSNLKQAIEQSGIDRERLEATLVDRLRRHAGEGQFELMAQLIQALPERLIRKATDLSLVREDLYFLLGRIAAQSGEAREIIPLVNKQVPSPTEEISLLAGVAIGLEDSRKAAKTTTQDGSPQEKSREEIAGE